MSFYVEAYFPLHTGMVRLAGYEISLYLARHRENGADVKEWDNSPSSLN